MTRVVHIGAGEDHNPEREEEDAHGARGDLVSVAANGHFRCNSVREGPDGEVVEDDVDVGENNDADADATAEGSIGCFGGAEAADGN